LASATAEMETDAAKKAQWADEIRGLKDTEATFHTMWVTAKENYDGLVEDDKRINDANDEAKNNASMET